MIPEYLTRSQREGIEIPLRPFLFLIHATLGWRLLHAFHNANNWLRPLLWQCVPNINTQYKVLAPLLNPIVVHTIHSLPLSHQFSQTEIFKNILCSFMSSYDF